MRQFAARVVWGAVSGMWKGAFRIAGRLPRSRAAALQHALQPAGSVLVVAPHPDDETIGCAGAITWHLRAGDAVRVLVLTDGGRSRSATPAEREAEATQAATILGGSWELCALPEGGWAEATAAMRLRDEMDARRPSAIYAPSCVDYHPEHVRVAAALAGVLRETVGRPAARTEAPRPASPPALIEPDHQGPADAGQHPSPVIRVYEVGVPLGRTLATHVLRLDRDAALLKDGALRAYRSQRATIAGVRRLHAYNRALFASGEEVEVFWQMTAEQYCALARTAARLPQRFRGVRYRPITDPLCYLVGRGARARLRKATL